MNVSQLAARYGIPKKVINTLRDSGYDALYPPQVEAFKSGVLGGKNLILAIPTAAGKTLVAEVCMLRSILKNNGTCLYVVPLRALASEKYEDFRKKYAPLGVSVGIATGEYDLPGNKLARYQILIATSEKVDSLLRMRARWLGESLSVAVLDEIHYIQDPSRGPTLEIVAARLRQVNPELQLLALSATISNGEELAAWLDADLISSDWRPVPLLEGIYSENKLFYSDFTTRVLAGKKSNPIEPLVIDTIDDRGQILVFVNSRRSTRTVAHSLAPAVQRRLSPGDKESLQVLARAVEGVLSEPTQLCRDLAHVVRSGVAFHHAGLHREQRKLIENAFRSNSVKVICATPTLAAGVNLPARRVVVRDWHRYQSGRGSQPIPIFEYKQFAGRAGRPGYDTTGEAILVAKKQGDRERLFEHYITGAAEPLRSQLGHGGALASHVLASIASGYAVSKKDILHFLSLTFFSVQEDVAFLSLKIDEILDFLLREELIFCRDYISSGYSLDESAELHPTAFGSTISRLYLDPLSGLTIKNGLLKLGRRPPTEIELLHLICCCPDMALLNVNKADYTALKERVLDGEMRLLVDPPAFEDEERRSLYIAAAQTAHMLLHWINERTEDAVCERFGIGPGDIRRHIETADWLLYSTGRIASLCDADEALPAMDELRQRVKYGIKRELLELVSLKGIGRARARNLFNSGFRSLEKIRKASTKKLSAVPAIGPRIAQSIKKQL
jgi:helicase